MFPLYKSDSAKIAIFAADTIAFTTGKMLRKNPRNYIKLLTILIETNHPQQIINLNDINEERK